VAYSYLPDGEVRATFTYGGSQYAEQNYNLFSTDGGIALVQSGGVFAFPYTGAVTQADITLLGLAGQIASSSPASQVIFSGFSFATPLYYVDDASPYYIDSPANAFGVRSSSAVNVPPGLYELTTNTNGALVSVTPVNISFAGVITTSAKIVPEQVVLSSPALISASALQTEIMDQMGTASGSLSNISNIASNAGYLVYESQDDSSLIIRDPVTNVVVATIGEVGD